MEGLDHAGDVFARALAERNRLSHSFYRQHNFRLNSEAGRAIMLADLRDIHTRLLAAYKLALEVAGVGLSSVQPPVVATRHLELK